jgi:hypothetical protein
MFARVRAAGQIEVWNLRVTGNADPGCDSEPGVDARDVCGASSAVAV